jgi:hypothetical protein
MRVLARLLALALPLVASASTPLPDGKYACLVLGTGMNYVPTYDASVLGTIVLRDGGYVAEGYKGAGGKVTRKPDDRLRFEGGPLDGWVAAIDQNSSGPFFRFREKSHGDPGPKTRIGDHLCFLRK